LFGLAIVAQVDYSGVAMGLEGAEFLFGWLAGEGDSR
jgi:hypothetical protein